MKWEWAVMKHVWHVLKVTKWDCAIMKWTSINGDWGMRVRRGNWVLFDSLWLIEKESLTPQKLDKLRRVLVSQITKRVESIGISNGRNTCIVISLVINEKYLLRYLVHSQTHFWICVFKQSLDFLGC